ncbi:MAG: replication factor C small subunit [Nanoarchaeota archaeon]|nr:replication factor C small subunit [Nanoarchaeota archaeon]
MSEIEIWTEKYRPSNLKEVVGQKEIVDKLSAFVRKKNIPHLLFAGPAGVGKTTCAMAMARELFGENWHANFLEMNASDERGIDTIRTKVKDFARTKPIGDVPFKIILLDEADALTSEAQHALRRMMENYTSTCRFILDCNYSSKIILPIQSRCVIFRFRPLEEDEVRKYIEKIVKNENLKLDDGSVKAIIDSSEGDLRKVTNILQSCAAMDKQITEEMVYSVAGIAKPKEIKGILEAAMKGELKSAKDKMLDVMLRYGLSGLDVIKLINKTVWEMDMDDKKKVKLIDKIGEYEFRIVEGADEYLQIEALLAQFAAVD